jgi:hypothetical protein
MKNRVIKKSKPNFIIVILVSFAFSGHFAQSSVLLTDFNSAIGVDSLTWSQGTRTWTGTQIVGTLYNDGTGPFNLTSALATPASVSSGLQAEVTAILNSSVPAGSFAITLENTASQMIVANFNWADFVVGQSKSVSKAFEGAVGVDLATWNRASVSSWNLVSSGNGSAVNVTFTGLSAIPEPSSLSLLVVAMASTMAIRRKKSPNRE